MLAFDAYKEYVALKNHFTKDNYDYIKYNGHSRVKADSFNKRKDKVFFEKLAKHPDVHGFLLANLSDNPKHWIRDLAYSEDAELTYKDWLKRNQSLTYNYRKDFKKIMESMNEDQHHPSAIRLYLGGEISLESLCIYVKMVDAISKWNTRLEYDPIWKEIRMKIEKYSPFVKFEKPKIKQIMVDILDQLDYTK